MLANLAKVLAKICICAKNFRSFPIFSWTFPLDPNPNYCQKSMIKRLFYAQQFWPAGAAKPNILPLHDHVINGANFEVSWSRSGGSSGEKSEKGEKHAIPSCAVDGQFCSLYLMNRPH